MHGTPRTNRRWQRDFARWAEGRDALGCFMQQRLGKTMAVHRWMDSRCPDGPKLVLCPLSVVEEWRRSLDSDGHRVFTMPGGGEMSKVRVVQEAAKLAAEGGAWFVTNPESMLAKGNGRSKMTASFLARLPWHGVVIDESTRIRNPKAQLTKVALRHLATAPYRALASGLPNPESPLDMVTQLFFIAGPGGEVMGCRDYWQWRARWCTAVGHDWVPSSKALKLLRDESRRCCWFLSRQEAGVGEGKQREVRWVRLPKRIMDAIVTARREFRVGRSLTSNALSVATWEAQIAGGRMPVTGGEDLTHSAKLDELQRILEEEYPKQPVVVWARYTAELEAALLRVKRMRLRAALCTGEVPVADRIAAVDSLQEGRLDVLVAQPQCLKMGVNLSRARVAVVLSNYFDHEIRAQLEDRVVTVDPAAGDATIIDVVAEGTIDEAALEALTQKKMTSSAFNSRLADALAALGAGRRAA